MNQFEVIGGQLYGYYPGITGLIVYGPIPREVFVVAVVIEALAEAFGLKPQGATP